MSVVDMTDDISINREDISLEKVENNAWEISIEGVVYLILYERGIFSVSKQYSGYAYGYGGSEKYETFVYIAEFDDAFDVARFFVQEII